MSTQDDDQSQPRYPTVLVRLAAIESDELEELLIDAWRSQAPQALVDEYDAANGA